MTKQTSSFMSLGKSYAGNMFRLCAFTLAATMAVCGGASAQENPATATPAPPPVKKAVKPAAKPAEKTFGKYNVHQSIELGGRIAQKSGSNAMWATMVNQSTGMRVLSHSLQMRTTDPSKTPFFDRLTSESFGYGGDPNDVSILNFGKGNAYEFAGTFRRDRNYFDYNLLANSLLGPVALIPEPSSLHLFNTVRRSTDTLVTLFPVSKIHFRLGYNHGTHEGPTYSSVHEGGDVQVMQWFRNGADTFTAGVDANLARRTSLSYDQFYVLYKGDSTYRLASTPFQLKDGTPVSLGIDTLAAATCGSGANKGPEVSGNVANAYCSLSAVQSQVAPTRTTFPTEQLRFASKYWDRVSMNGRISYSGGVSNVNHFNETFTGLLARTFTRQDVDTGALNSSGQLAHNKRVSVNADYAVEADITDRIAITDTINFWDFRIPGSLSMSRTVWAGTAAKPPNALTPISSITPTTTVTPGGGFLSQKNVGNTVLAIVTARQEWKLSAGWRYNVREITLNSDPTSVWHQNWALLGTVIQPTPAFRLSANYDRMWSAAANGNTSADTYTREGLNRSDHVRVRTVVKPEKWLNLSMSTNVFVGKNTDPLVNHHEHNYDVSMGGEVIASDSLSFDVNFARDETYSRTDLCYLYGLPAAPYNEPASLGTCLLTDANQGGTSPSTPVTSQLRLGNGYYRAPVNFYSGTVNWAPTRLLKLNGGARVTDTRGSAELLNPYQVAGALRSTVLLPFADVQLLIAPQWTWHGNWNYQDYNETDGGPAARSFHGHIVTLGVRYAF